MSNFKTYINLLIRFCIIGTHVTEFGLEEQEESSESSDNENESKSFGESSLTIQNEGTLNYSLTSIPCPSPYFNTR